MDEWVTTKEAEKIKRVGLSQHRLAELARQGRIVAKRIGQKKWLVKIVLNNTRYDIAYVQKIPGQAVEVVGDERHIPFEQRLYKETRHKRKIRKLARELAERIKLPSLWDKDLWKNLPVDFQPGKYYLPIGAVEIGEHKQIKVNYYDVSTDFAELHLIKGLFNHLNTSSLPRFAELVGDKGKLDNLIAEAGKYSLDLLNFLKLIADEIKGYRTTVNFHDEMMPGLTRWFILTIWKDAIDKASGYSWIHDSWYKPHESIPGTNLWQLRCGACAIGIARSKKTLKTYESWHKKLRDKYARHQTAKNIHAKSQKLSNIAQDIRQLLQEFSDMERLPGHCELC